MNVLLLFIIKMYNQQKEKKMLTRFTLKVGSLLSTPRIDDMSCVNKICSCV